MTWEEVCEHPSLRNLPFKIETNHYGQVVMSPAKIRHQFLGKRIVALLDRLLPGGEAFSELAVKTPAGVKVTDVAWVSAGLAPRLEALVACDVAPEICVEVLSASNTAAEMAEKRRLYFAQGAKEVWVVQTDSRRVTFYRAPTGRRRSRSELCPEFPAVVPR